MKCSVIAPALERLAVAAQDVDQFVLDQFLDSGAGGLQVLPGIELVGMLGEELADSAVHTALRAA